MPTVKISALPAAASAASGATIPATNAAGTTTEKVTVAQIAATANASAPVQSVAGKTGVVTLAVGDVSNAVSTTDSRLSDARTPIAHSHDASAITTGVLADGRLSANVVLTTDSRLANARTPTAHATSHRTGGTDVIPNVVVTPAALTADANNYALGTGDIFRLSGGTAARSITGIVAGVDGQAVLLINVGTFAITLQHLSTLSTAANQIRTPSGSALTVAANGGAALLIYDTASTCWRAI